MEVLGRLTLTLTLTLALTLTLTLALTLILTLTLNPHPHPHPNPNPNQARLLPAPGEAGSLSHDVATRWYANRVRVMTSRRAG